MPTSPIKIRKGDVTLMLLGSYEHIHFRRQVKQELNKMGFKKKNILIMEDILNKRSLDFGSLDNKFEWIVDKYDPTLFFAIFHKNTKNLDGVMFEIGWLCGKLRREILHEKLRFMFEKGYDTNKEKTTGYITALFTSIFHNEFNESIAHEKCSEWIRTVLVPIVKRQNP